MGLQFYKPNKASKGTAAHFTFNSKDGQSCVFLEIIKQVSWDASARGGLGNGIFKNGEKSLVKLSTTEAGWILNSIERRVDIPPLFHKTDDGSSTIKFSIYKPKVKDEGGQWVEGKEASGFSLSISKTDFSAAIALNWGEARELKSFLENALRHIWDGIYSADIKGFKEAQARKEENTSRAEPTKPAKSVKDFVKEPSKTEEAGDDIPF